MTELGQFLREKRQEKEWGIEEVQARTKIQARYLTAIEEGDYDRLPGAFYARAFIKSYAEALGLEPEQVFADFEHDLPKPKQEAVELPSRAERSRKMNVTQDRRKKSTLIPAILVTVFAVVILAGIWVAVQSPFDTQTGENQPDQNENQTEIVNEPEDNDEEAAEDPEEQDEGENSAEASGGDEADSTENTNGAVTFQETADNFNSIYTIQDQELEITLIFEDGDSYVDFREEPFDDQTIVATADSGQTEEEQSFTFDDVDAITLNIGYTPALTILVNGEELEYAVDPSERDHQRITLQRE